MRAEMNFVILRCTETMKEISKQQPEPEWLVLSTASTLHTQENTAEKIIPTAADSPSLQNKNSKKYFYSFTGEILNPTSQSIFISSLPCWHRVSRGKEVGCVLVQSSPRLHCPLCNSFNTLTGEHIKSIASGRTVTSNKAHNRVPISSPFSFAEKVPKSFQRQEPPPHQQHGTGHSSAPKNGQSSTPAASHNNNKITKFTLSRKSYKHPEFRFVSQVRDYFFS